MPKKNMTPEERKAFGEKMRAARENAKLIADERAKKDGGVTNGFPFQESKTPEPKIELTQKQFDQIMQRLEKAEEAKTQTVTTVAPPSGFDQFGKPTGVIQKYSVDPAHYHDPRESLAALAELERVAFKHNYMLDWDVEQLIYDTKYGSSFSEPKFTLVLWRKMLDEDGVPNGKRILIQNGVFFEDPITAVKEATNLGIPLDNTTSSEFLEQMRFLRYKQWLLDIFNPKRPESTKSKRTPQVIGGVVYEVEEYSNVV